MENTVDSLWIADFDYTLPDEKIAIHPLVPRDRSQLLVVRNREIKKAAFRDLPSLLPSDSLMIFNNTRVVEARLLFQKPTGSRIEIFCLEPLEVAGGITAAMDQKGSAMWKCLVGNAASWTGGLVLERRLAFDQSQNVLRAEQVEKRGDHFLILFSWKPSELTFAEVLHQHGQIPLPPYIKRNSEKQDSEQYQTVYAKQPGSVAAPTAGLHFTDAVLADLENHQIKKDFVTLHVGAGTFKPVKSAAIKDHVMHSEYIDVSDTLVKNLLGYSGKSITAVGTTSLRTIESVYWIGHRLLENPSLSNEELQLGQWYPYRAKNDHPVEDCLNAVSTRIKANGNDPLITKTALMIAPGYTFKLVDQLVTNFHQPKSTLLLLVAAFAGEIWKSAYEYALENDFRFLSYGDACLFFRQ
jgi:S-adenosylmethionine:tRNA ribosyltransferase-isomerase